MKTGVPNYWQVKPLRSEEEIGIVPRRKANLSGDWFEVSHKMDTMEAKLVFPNGKKVYFVSMGRALYLSIEPAFVVLTDWYAHNHGLRYLKINGNENYTIRKRYFTDEFLAFAYNNVIITKNKNKYTIWSRSKFEKHATESEKNERISIEEFLRK